jgi:hypothetical protein
MQKVSMAERYEAEIKKLKVNEDLRQQMIICNKIELGLAETEAQTRISDSQYAFDQAYQARISKERQIEDKYAADLRAYWESRPNGEGEIAKGIEALRVQHAESYCNWDMMEREKHQLVVDGAQEEVDRVRRKHTLELAAMMERMSNAEKEIDRAKVTDQKWLEAVASVRVEMMLAMEEDEYLREEDWNSY